MSGIDLAGRRALVTGGARGLGAGMAERLATAGAAVMIGDVLEGPGKDTAAAIMATGRTASFVKLDVTEEGDWETAVASTVDELGGFDILVNNAGIELTALAVDADADALRRMLEVNVLGTALGVKHGLRAMRPGGAAGRGGSIVNVSSVAATTVFPGISGYAATQSGVDRLTRIAAAESGKLGYGVRVNCIYPGLVATEMGVRLANELVDIGLAGSLDEVIANAVGRTPLGRLGDVADVADAVVFLASDAARFITGAGLPVDGGMGS